MAGWQDERSGGAERQSRCETSSRLSLKTASGNYLAAFN
jgi:hypothetical protein